MVNICIYEENTMISKYTVNKTDIEGLVTAINEDKNSLITAVKLGDTELIPNVSISFSGGVSGSGFLHIYKY